MPRIPPPIIALIAAFMIWALAHFLPVIRFRFPMQVVAAIGLALLGIALDIYAAIHFRLAKTTVNPITIENASSLVTRGPFAISRNPMYLGMVVFLAGVAVYEGGASGFIMLPLFVAYITAFQITPEERVMRRKFGDEYATYCARVRRWI